MKKMEVENFLNKIRVSDLSLAHKTPTSWVWTKEEMENVVSFQRLFVVFLKKKKIFLILTQQSRELIAPYPVSLLTESLNEINELFLSGGKL